MKRINRKKFELVNHRGPDKPGTFAALGAAFLSGRPELPENHAEGDGGGDGHRGLFSLVYFHTTKHAIYTEDFQKDTNFNTTRTLKCPVERRGRCPPLSNCTRRSGLLSRIGFAQSCGSDNSSTSSFMLSPWVEALAPFAASSRRAKLLPNVTFLQW